MEFMGITYHGPQNYIKDLVKPEYHEPVDTEDALAVLKAVEECFTVPKGFKRPDINIIRVIDYYVGRVDGFAYGSMQRFMKMKRKGVIKPVGPCDMYRLPPTASSEFGWFQHDPALLNSTWYKTHSRYPQPTSPNTLILDKARKNNKYATLF